RARPLRVCVNRLCPAHAPARHSAAVPAGPWRSAESPGAWPAESARPRSAEYASPRAGSPAIFARPRFADRELTTVEHLTVESLDRLLGRGPLDVLDEREASR